MDGARSIASVLHGRLQRLELPDQGHEVTWSQRTPANAPEVARELAAGLDGRVRELGERMIAQPQPWLLRHLGMLAPDASPALREEYSRRVGIAAGYRDAAGITDPGQAVSPEPHRDNPELDVMRLRTMKALEITEDSYRTMTRGELEARILDGDRTQATAPPEVSSQLRITAQAEADAWQQSADAEVAHDQPGAVNAEALASQLAVEKTRLEAMNATYEGWAGSTRTVREAAGKAKAELGRRRQAQPEESSQTMARWWRQLDADLDAMDRAISRERQAAMAAGKPWPPEKTAQAPNRRSEAGAVAEPLQRDGDLRASDYDLPVSGPGPAEPGAEALRRGTSPASGQPGWTPCKPALTRPHSVSLRTTLSGRHAPSTRHAWYGKPTLSPRSNGRPRLRTTPKSRCRSGRVRANLCRSNTRLSA